MSARKLLADVVKANAALIAAGDPWALKCVLAQADDYARAAGRVRDADDGRVAAEEARTAASGVCGDTAGRTAARRRALLHDLDLFEQRRGSNPALRNAA